MFPCAPALSSLPPEEECEHDDDDNDEFYDRPRDFLGKTHLPGNGEGRVPGCAPITLNYYRAIIAITGAEFVIDSADKRVGLALELYLYTHPRISCIWVLLTSACEKIREKVCECILRLIL